MTTRFDAYLKRVQEFEAKEENLHKLPLYQRLSFTMLSTPCGCTIEGDGNLPSPLRIKFCDVHAKVMT
jgi:hypothetical protein